MSPSAPMLILVIIINACYVFKDSEALLYGALFIFYRLDELFPLTFFSFFNEPYMHLVNY